MLCILNYQLNLKYLQFSALFGNLAVDQVRRISVHPALLLDAIVSKAAQLQPKLRAIARAVLYPFIQWRIRGIAHTIATQCRWLSTTSWEDVEKHGQNVVYCKQDAIDVFTKEKTTIGVWVVDYKNHTARTVLDVPEEYQKTGATF